MDDISFDDMLSFKICRIIKICDINSIPKNIIDNLTSYYESKSRLDIIISATKTIGCCIFDSYDFDTAYYSLLFVSDEKISYENTQHNEILKELIRFKRTDTITKIL